jgi:hypothetical protein
MGHKGGSSMNVHVLAYKDYCGHICVRGVFTDANLDLAENYADRLDDFDDDPVLETIEVDDPEDIASLEKEIRELEECFADVCGEDGDASEVKDDGTMTNCHGASV